MFFFVVAEKGMGPLPAVYAASPAESYDQYSQYNAPNSQPYYTQQFASSDYDSYGQDQYNQTAALNTRSGKFSDFVFPRCSFCLFFFYFSFPSKTNVCVLALIFLEGRGGG